MIRPDDDQGPQLPPFSTVLPSIFLPDVRLIMRTASGAVK